MQLPWIEGALSGAIKLSEEQRIDVIKRGQEVVSKTQVKDLHQVFSILDKVLSDKQQAYYIVIDGLDTNWVEESLRYKLIMGLIFTAKEFIPVKNAKIIIALRRDLIERVFRLTRGPGFQEEKYQGLYLRLTWSKDKILKILDTRIAHLVSYRHTKQAVGHRDLLPKKYRDQPIGDFIYSVADRPRDVIALFNICILVAEQKSKLTERDLTKAVAEYSRGRLRALADEWHADYPDLLDFTDIFSGCPKSFKISTIQESAIEDLCLNIASVTPEGKGKLHEDVKRVLDSVMTPSKFRAKLLLVLYHIGLVGLKTSADMSESWADDAGQAVTGRQFGDNTSVVISAKYAIALGIIQTT